MLTTTYQIVLPQFEGPFDLLLFFIERDELDIYNIPIARITNDFLDYIHGQESLNIELSSEFILFVSNLMRIKAKTLLPRKDLDEQGNEIDPRQELVDKLLEYKRFKEASVEMAEQESLRMMMIKRGNILKEMQKIGEEAAEGTEIQSITLYKLMTTYEKLIRKKWAKELKPQHVVYKYNYTMEGVRSAIVDMIRENEAMAFENLITFAENRIHAIFIFLNLLELTQQQYIEIVTGKGTNNFIIEWNADAPDYQNFTSSFADIIPPSLN